MFTMSNIIIKLALAFFLCLHGTISTAQCCDYTLSMHDSYGDGWNGATLEVLVNNLSVGIFSASNSGSSATIPVCDNDIVELIYTPGDYENENSYEWQDASWNIVFQDGPTPATGSVSSSTVNCNTPLVPGSHPCLAIPIDSIQCISADNTGFQGSGLTPNCSWFEGGDIWYSMQVPASGNLSFETLAGSIDDTGIAVWAGDDCNNLQIIGCDDDGGAVYLSFLLLYDLVPEQTIYIQAWKWGGGTGSFEICITDLGTVVFDSSELPIVMINTLDQPIVQDTKIDCLMDIKYNGPGNITYVTDSPNVYSGNIGIEIRGATSAGYAQTPYNFETRTPAGDNNQVALLGMPEENDWVLLSHYNDRSLLRNMLSFKLFGDMGNYSVRAQWCELMVDNKYKGIYAIGEKIKRDSNRVNIAKLTVTDTLGDDLTGGYILQQNYWDSNNSFLSNYHPIDHPDFDVAFVYESPKADELLPVQKAYIASYVDSLETALYGPDFADPVIGYRKYMDVKSFIDYFIVNEFARNPDGFKKSVFYHKDKYSNGGKLKAGPVWDFDWAYKKYNYCEQNFSGSDGSGWAHLINDCFTDNYSTGWYLRLMQDSTFNDELRCTYEEYRQTMLNMDNIAAYFDEMESLVQNAQARHFQKWPLLGRSGFDDEIEPVATTYSGELDTLKSWINKRLLWLDDHIPGNCIPTSINETVLSEMFHCYPNPANEYFIIDYSLLSPTNVSVQVSNALGAAVFSTNTGLLAAGKHTLTIETSHFPPGIYMVSFKTGSKVGTKKIVIAQ
jgi:hypothetical protein